MLEVKGVSKIYRMGENEVHALRDVSLTIDAGDFVAIMGPSGSGKSTLMHLLGLLDTPTTGSYAINGREAANLSENELAVLRREEVGFIFQQFNLLPRMTAVENVALPMVYSRPRPLREIAVELLQKVGLGARLEHRTNELSGGQQQRVAIARAIVNRPRVLFADEPTGNLDSASEKEIMSILEDLNRQGITIVIVTHEEEIGVMARRRIRMRDGRIQGDERLRALEAARDSLAPMRAERSPVNASTGQKLIQLLEHFRQGLNTLAANKVRTALSMLGILIGVAAVVAMLAIGRGAQQAIESQLSSLGSNLLVLRPGSSRMGGVTQEAGTAVRIYPDDAQFLSENVVGINRTAAVLNGRAQVTFENRNWSSQIIGTGPAYDRMHAMEPERGRFFTDQENQTRSRMAVLGQTVVRELFGERSPIGEMIKINKISFQVIGVLPPRGATGWRDQDDVVVIPVFTAMYRLFGRNYVDYLEIEMRPDTDLGLAEQSIAEAMVDRKKIPPSRVDNAISVRNMADIQAAVTESNKTMSILLASIAAISLLVGGIGIMNIMLVSVTERTREIGLRKAVGAKPGDILNQFLIESVVISAIGGGAGILLGWGISLAVSAALGWATSVSPASVLLAFAFSAGVGIVFGIYPARKAAVLNPIDALRYE